MIKYIAVALLIFSLNGFAKTKLTNLEKKYAKVIQQKELPELEQNIYKVLPSPDSLFVSKSKRIIFLLKDGKAYKSYSMKLGKEPVGAKVKEGDNRTPEGSYIIDGHNNNSKYYKSLHISYPNEEDKRIAKEIGIKPGHSIMIHGRPSTFLKIFYSKKSLKKDWTQGCIALTDKDVVELYDLVIDGTPIWIQK